MRRCVLPILIFVLAAVYYVVQACPTFYFWDSAELTAAVVTGGVPHPPGFPTLLLLSALWAKLLPLDMPHALNLFSAFFGALGLALWYLVTIRFIRKLAPETEESQTRFFAALIVAAIGVSLTYSIQAVRFEIYTLNFAGFAALILLAMKISESRAFSLYSYLAFWSLIGLLLGAHNLTVILALPGILIIAWRGRHLPAVKFWAGSLLSLLLAGILYLMIFIRAGDNPDLNWGDPSNLSRFVDYILLKGFSVSAGRLGLGHLGEQFKFVFDVLIAQAGLLAIIVSIYGAVVMARKKPALILPLGIIFILNILSVTFAENYFYENYDLHGYLMISLAVLGVFMAAGFLSISRIIFKRLSRPGEPPTLLTRFLPGLIAVLILAFPASRNFLSADLSSVTTARLFAEEFLSGAPDDAIVITSSYNTYFCVMAENSLENKSNERDILNLYNWDHRWGREATNRRFGLDIDLDNSRQGYYRDFLNHYLKTRPIYIEYDLSSSPLAHLLRPRGLGYSLDVADTTALDETDTRKYEAMSLASNELESVRTWVLWFQNRGEYFERRGDRESALDCFTVVESLAVRVEIK